MAEDNDLIRTFICIRFNDEIVKEIARVQEELGKIKFTGKMTELENLHLTLKFLGEIGEEKLEEIRKKLREIKFNAFELKLGIAGTFSVRGNPRIVWIKAEGKEIWELQKKIDDSLKELFKKEERFMSHLTIARVKYVKNKKAFVEYAKGLGVKEIKLRVDRFYLMKSELKPPMPIYSVLEEYECVKEKI